MRATGALRGGGAGGSVAAGDEERFPGFAACSSRCGFRGLGPGLPGLARDPGEGLVGVCRGRSRVNHAAGAGAPCAQARAHAAIRARAPLAPMGGAPGRRSRTASPRSARVGAAVHRGRRRGVRVRRAPVPGSAFARNFGYVCSAGGGGSELFTGFGRRPPDASRPFRGKPLAMLRSVALGCATAFRRRWRRRPRPSIVEQNSCR